MKNLEYTLCEICANNLARASTADVFLGDMKPGHPQCEGCGETCGYEYTYVQIDPRRVEAMENL